jgi:hypothetical protein
MKKLCFIFIFFALVFLEPLYSQTVEDENRQKIASVIENYFDLEREAIHLHVDKSTYITHETIWFQGYILNRKTNKPYFTTNVYVVMYDGKGTILSEQLVFGNNGVFSGNIKLKPSLASGDYYLQVYTNWMNNFTEDESTLVKVNLINPEEGIKNNLKIKAETLGITLHPEGGHFVKNLSNSLGIRLADCRGNSPQDLEASLLNSQGAVLKTFKLDKFGYGRFEVSPIDDAFKVVVSYSDKTIEQVLPSLEPFGFGLEVNNFTLEGKTIVKIKSNPSTMNLLEGKKLYLLAHQDQKYTLIDLTLSLEQTISIDHSELFEGITTLRIIDSDMKEWAERLIYNYPKPGNSFSLVKSENKANKIKIVGYSTYANSLSSITVLPHETLAKDTDNLLYGLTIKPYIAGTLSHSNYYFQALGRAKQYALDLALLNQASMKYSWEFMKINTPTTQYSFDIGLSIKGTIDSKIQNKTYHKVKATSFKDLLMLSSDVSEKGEYGFMHLLLADSTQVKLSLQKLPNFEEIKGNLTPRVFDRKKPFYKPYKPTLSANCDDVLLEQFESLADLPSFSAKTIQLAEVKVVSNKKKLAYESKLGNGNLRGFKIDGQLLNQTLLDFLEGNGFTVVRDLGMATIYSRLRTTLNSGPATPAIFIDERQIMSHDELSAMKMNEIDEIYLNPHAIVASINNNFGVIKIYRKKISLSNYNMKSDSVLFFIKDGFSRIESFKNADYDTALNSGFDHFGLIDWAPRTAMDEQGQFSFEITDYNKPTCTVLIEGMSSEGQLFEEEQTIDLK